MKPFQDLVCIVTWLTLGSLAAVTFATGAFATDASAPSRPYSMSWVEAATPLIGNDPAVLDDAQFILAHAIWQADRHPDSPDAPEPSQLGTTAAKKLDEYLVKAAHHDPGAFGLILALVELSEPRKDLKSLSRTDRTGTLLLINDNHYADDHHRKYHAGSAGRVAVADGLRRLNPELRAEVLKSLALAVLSEPENASRTQGTTALLASPEFAAYQDTAFWRDYFLLMSTYPLAATRMAAWFALGDFAIKDPFVLAQLQLQAASYPEKRFTSKDLQDKKKIWEEIRQDGALGLSLEVWQEQMTLLYQSWIDQFPLGILDDMGDYNWERMANAAAGQALLRAAANLNFGRDLELDDGERQAQENITTHQNLIELGGLQAGNGTGFFIHADLTSLEGKQTGPAHLLSHRSLSLDSRPDHAWVIMGMTPPQMFNVFEAMLDGGQALHYGGLRSLVAELKYRHLDYPPPEIYSQALDEFKRRLRSKYQAWKKEFSDLGVRPISVGDVGKELSSEPHDQKVLVFTPKPKPEVQPVEIPFSLFNAPIEKLYAARALALLGETEEAELVMLSLLPQEWQTKPEDGQALAESLRRYFHSDDSPPRSAQLTESSKLRALRQLFESFRLVKNEMEARKIVVRYLAELKDNEMIVQAQSCAKELYRD